MTFTCEQCGLSHPHDHGTFIAPNGDERPVIIHRVEDPRAEVQDPDTGEVIFPAVKGPLRAITNPSAFSAKESSHD